jgi:branched-chain amino acid transport system permease protein
VDKKKLLAVGVVGIIVAVLIHFVTSRNTSAAEWWEINGPVLLQSLASGLLMGGIYGLVALGLTLIFGVLEIVNFAHGTLMTVGMYTTFWAFELYGIDPYLSLVISVPLLFLLGITIERVIIRPLIGGPMHNHLLLTMGLSLFIMNLFLVVFGAEPMTIRTGYSGSRLFLGGIMISIPRLAAFVVALSMMAILFLIMHRTDLGKAIRAAADDSEGAALSGINVKRMYLITFGLGTACVGAAGSMVIPFLIVDPHAGETFNILSYVIVVLGGMGSMPGAMLGGIIVGLTEALGAVFLPGSSKLVGVFILFILILLFRPEGLMTRSHGG